jgi:hypothetical protein
VVPAPFAPTTANGEFAAATAGAPNATVPEKIPNRRVRSMN